jgi:3-oxoacyl-[acyl-carrier protein] reductase
VAEAKALGVALEALPLDLEDRAQWPSALEALLREPVAGFGLVAGICRDASVMKMEEADWDRVLTVNFGFHARLLQALRAPGKLAPGAVGLLVGSIVGARGNHGQSAYAASKGALLDLLPLAPPTLRLNVLLPPLVPSPMLAGLTPEANARLFSSRSMDDPDPAASCAEAGAFLLGPGASYIQHQAVHADSRVTALGWD